MAKNCCFNFGGSNYYSKAARQIGSQSRHHVVKTSLASFFQQGNNKLNHFPSFYSNGDVYYSLVFLSHYVHIFIRQGHSLFHLHSILFRARVRARASALITQIESIFVTSQIQTLGHITRRRIKCKKKLEKKKSSLPVRTPTV